jgi:hypothetical protein
MPLLILGSVLLAPSVAFAAGAERHASRAITLAGTLKAT